MKTVQPQELAVAVVCRQLRDRGPLPESSVATIIENATGCRPTASALTAVATAAKSSVVRDVKTRVWSMAHESALMYAASKPGGVAVATLAPGPRLFLREHSARLLDGVLKMLAPGVVGLSTDASRKTIVDVVRDAGPRGLPVSKCPGSAADAIKEAAVVYVSGRLYAVPAGPRFDANASSAWKARCDMFL
jgi:hypothetical protein